jgi:hypothetical protein
MKHWGAFWLKPVTDEQVFYDKFLCDKFYLPSARVYNVTNFIWQVFIWQVLFTGVNVSTSLLWQFISSQQCNSTADNASARAKRRHFKILFLANHIKCSDYLTSFLCWPIQTNKICTLSLTIFSMTRTSACHRKIVKVQSLFVCMG